MKKLNYTVPFNGFSHLGFLTCMAAAHAYLVYPTTPKHYPNGWDYGTDIGALQEDWYFTLGTMTGHNSHLECFDGRNQRPDQLESVDFCMRFLGYAYQIVHDDICSAAHHSIEQGYPAIAVLQDNHDCRVVIGYTDTHLIFADPKGAQGDNHDPEIDAIEQLIVITDTVKPTLTLIDGLRRIEAKLVEATDHVWQEWRSHFSVEWDTWEKTYRGQLAKTKETFHRLMQMMWNFDHCHNFSCTFAHKAYPALWDDRLADLCCEIDSAYAAAHDLQWALQALHDLRDWRQEHWCSKEFGMFMFADMGLARLEQDDRRVLDAVRKMIAILSNKE